jgi:hypothetical protein
MLRGNHICICWTYCHVCEYAKGVYFNIVFTGLVVILSSTLASSGKGQNLRKLILSYLHFPVV